MLFSMASEAGYKRWRHYTDVMGYSVEDAHEAVQREQGPALPAPSGLREFHDPEKERERDRKTEQIRLDAMRKMGVILS